MICCDDGKPVSVWVRVSVCVCVCATQEGRMTQRPNRRLLEMFLRCLLFSLRNILVLLELSVGFLRQKKYDTTSVGLVVA